jgi:glutathione synthase/RimK-type ligase-like ATP-grasp enzyme
MPSLIWNSGTILKRIEREGLMAINKPVAMTRAGS